MTPGFPLGPEPLLPTRGDSPAGAPRGQGVVSRGKFALRGVEGCFSGSYPDPQVQPPKAGSGSSSDPCPPSPGLGDDPVFNFN